ncbi:glucan endo-1,3-beta-glucosidase, basic vacuolar isoform-like protein [Canna indica]|uniref:Glucan endo-1,3-beta-glucosidase, basic vacuolar isoform-like protein n=1 Tax=Canna indica TaxID=4628 RepID=A0AAQ3KUQ3_9LILI|nr:glucan endo-1,3-beta-glucosidase, basic vacuolar isoform-like protein [Canna indica]
MRSRHEQERQLVIHNPTSLASDPSVASSWVQNNVAAFWPGVSFRYITVGNEVVPGSLAHYASNLGQISLPYALFTTPGVVIQDGQFGYQNLFDAITDAVYAELDKAGGANVAIVVSESGWPSASTENAQTYNQNLIRHFSFN